MNKDEWNEEYGWVPICGQHFNWDDYGVVIEPNDRPKCKKCLVALKRRTHD